MDDIRVTWWGYIHTNGSVIAKRYYDRAALRDARESTFVNIVVEPFLADNHSEAVKIIKNENMTHFEKTGRHFGYPACCIDWFVGRVFGNNPFPLTPEQEKVNGNNGFVPCPKCADRVASGEITIEDLIVDREHPLPYPNVDRKYMELLQE